VLCMAQKERQHLPFNRLTLYVLWDSFRGQTRSVRFVDRSSKLLSTKLQYGETQSIEGTTGHSRDVPGFLPSVLVRKSRAYD
jgi:hypothetical protein